MNIVAMPRNEKKPATSVTVVSRMDDEVAGSCPRRVSMIGMIAPAKPAATIARTIDAAMTQTRAGEPLQK